MVTSSPIMCDGFNKFLLKDLSGCHDNMGMLPSYLFKEFIIQCLNIYS